MKESTNFQKIQNGTRPTLPSEEMILVSEVKTSESLLCLSCMKSEQICSLVKIIHSAKKTHKILQSTINCKSGHFGRRHGSFQM